VALPALSSHSWHVQAQGKPLCSIMSAPVVRSSCTYSTADCVHANKLCSSRLVGQHPVYQAGGVLVNAGILTAIKVLALPERLTWHLENSFLGEWGEERAFPARMLPTHGHNLTPCPALKLDSLIFKKLPPNPLHIHVNELPLPALQSPAT